MRPSFRVLGLPFALLLSGACGGGSTAGGFEKTDGVGLGGDCDGVNVNCRSGLSCVSSKCAASGTTKDGAPCTIGEECASGTCGPSVLDGAGATPATCAPAGPGAAGDSCGGDADCGKGLRCAFDGTSFFPHCVAEGKTDVGGDCTKNTDCLQGLVCNANKCGTAVVPKGADEKGVPPYIPGPTAWTGAKCDDNVKTGITALFHVPRASDPPTEDFYRLPFPNDAARNKATGKVSFANHPHDVSSPLGFDAVKLYLDALESEPFGNYPTVYFRFDGEFVFDTVKVAGDDPQTRIVDLTEGPTFGQRQGIQAFFTNGRNKYICQNFVAIRPSFGAPLKPGGTYAVIMKKGVVTCSNRMGDTCTPGDAAKQHPDFTAMLGAAAPGDAALKDAYDSYAPLRKWMTTEKVAADDLLVATVFTVGDPTKVATKLRASVRAAPAPTAGEWVKCGSGAPEPCPQADAKDNRACGADNPDFDEYHALVDMPVFQQGTAPYLTSKDGGAIDGSAATIAPVRTEKVCAALTVPKGSAPASGWPIAIYAHGTGGSFRSHAADGSAKTLSKIDLGGGVTEGFAVLGIDQVEHGPRRGDSKMSPNDLFFNFANPAAARYNAQQGAADQHTLVRLAESLALAGGPKLDGTKIVYWGHSQGATEGALFLANDTTVKGAVLSGEGASLIDALTTKTQPVDIKDSLWLALGESSPKAADIWHPVLSLLQSWADPADPLNYAAMTVRVPGSTPAAFHHVFQPFGVKEDHYTPWATQMTFTLAGGLAFVGPGVDAHDFMTVASASGNVTVGTAKATAAMRQYAAAAGRDGHFVAFDVDQAKTDVAKFLARSARGEVPKVPE
jgi:hypothetical protein